MKTVADILKAKATQNVHSVSPETTVLEAIKLMADKAVGALLVLENERLMGIISERDYTRKMVLKGRSSFATPVSAIMTANVVTVTPTETSQKCMELMTDGHLRHLPVIDNGQLVGLLSIGDLVKSVIAEQQNIINHLEQYIRG